MGDKKDIFKSFRTDLNPLGFLMATIFYGVLITMLASKSVYLKCFFRILFYCLILRI